MIGATWFGHNESTSNIVSSGMLLKNWYLSPTIILIFRAAYISGTVEFKSSGISPLAEHRLTVCFEADSEVSAFWGSSLPCAMSGCQETQLLSPFGLSPETVKSDPVSTGALPRIID